MDLTTEVARSRFTAARVAGLATAGPDLRPHLVPVTFAVGGGSDAVIAIAIDHKPKRSPTRLRRLANIAANPRVSLLVDEYSDDWERLWWVRADGRATVVADGPSRASGVSWLVAKYPQYRDRPPDGPVILVAVDTWRGWAWAARQPED